MFFDAKIWERATFLKTKIKIMLLVCLLLVIFADISLFFFCVKQIRILITVEIAPFKTDSAQSSSNMCKYHFTKNLLTAW